MMNNGQQYQVECQTPSSIAAGGVQQIDLAAGLSILSTQHDVTPTPDSADARPAVSVGGSGPRTAPRQLGEVTGTVLFGGCAKQLHGIQQIQPQLLSRPHSIGQQQQQQHPESVDSINVAPPTFMVNTNHSGRVIAPPSSLPSSLASCLAAQLQGLPTPTNIGSQYRPQLLQQSFAPPAARTMPSASPHGTTSVSRSSGTASSSSPFVVRSILKGAGQRRVTFGPTIVVLIPSVKRGINGELVVEEAQEEDAGRVAYDDDEEDDMVPNSQSTTDSILSPGREEELLMVAMHAEEEVAAEQQHHDEEDVVVDEEDDEVPDPLMPTSKPIAMPTSNHSAAEEEVDLIVQHSAAPSVGVASDSAPVLQRDDKEDDHKHHLLETTNNNLSPGRRATNKSLFAAAAPVQVLLQEEGDGLRNPAAPHQSPTPPVGSSFPPEFANNSSSLGVSQKKITQSPKQQQGGTEGASGGCNSFGTDDRTGGGLAWGNAQPRVCAPSSSSSIDMLLLSIQGASRGSGETATLESMPLLPPMKQHQQSEDATHGVRATVDHQEEETDESDSMPLPQGASPSSLAPLPVLPPAESSETQSTDLFQDYLTNTMGILHGSGEKKQAVDDNKKKNSKQLKKSRTSHVEVLKVFPEIPNDEEEDEIPTGSAQFSSLPLRQPSPPVAPSQADDAVSSSLFSAPPPESPLFSLPPKQLFFNDAGADGSGSSNDRSRSLDTPQQEPKPNAINNSEHRDATSPGATDLLAAISGALGLPEIGSASTAEALTSSVNLSSQQQRLGHSEMKEEHATATPLAPPQQWSAKPTVELKPLLGVSIADAVAQEDVPYSLDSGSPTLSQLASATEHFPVDMPGHPVPVVEEVRQGCKGASLSSFATEEQAVNVTRGKRSRSPEERGRTSETQTTDPSRDQQSTIVIGSVGKGENEEEEEKSVVAVIGSEKKKASDVIFTCALCHRHDDVSPSAFKARRRKAAEAGIVDVQSVYHTEGPPARPGLFAVLKQEGKPDLVVHSHCAMWSPEVTQVGSGALKGVEKEVDRGNQLLCALCRQPGASLGCAHSTCGRCFHFPCALASVYSKSNVVKLFTRNYAVACRHHVGVVAERTPAKGSRPSDEGGRTSTVSDSSSDRRRSSSKRQSN